MSHLQKLVAGASPQMHIKQANQIFGNQMFPNSPFMMTNEVDRFIRDGYELNASVYSVVNLITRSIAMVPWQLFEVKNTKALTHLKSLEPHDTKRLKIKAHEFEEIKGHRALDTLNKPNGLQGKSEWINNVIGFKLVTGNSFVRGIAPEEGARKGEFQELWVMPPQRTIIIPNKQTGEPEFYQITQKVDTKFPTEEVMHIKFWNPDPDKFLYGMSPIMAARKVVTTSNDAYEASMSLNQNVGAIGMMTSKVDQDNPALTQPQAEQVQDSYDRRRTGPQKYGKMWVSNFPLTWTQFGMNAVDLQLLESLKTTKRDICSIYNVPSELLNDSENKTYSNMREARKALLTNAALPELASLRDELNRWYIPPFEANDGKRYFLDFDISMIPELQNEMESFVKQLAAQWWVTPEEKRIASNWGESGNPEFDQFFIPSNLIPSGIVNSAKYFLDAHREEK